MQWGCCMLGCVDNPERLSWCVSCNQRDALNPNGRGNWRTFGPRFSVQAGSVQCIWLQRECGILLRFCERTGILFVCGTGKLMLVVTIACGTLLRLCRGTGTLLVGGTGKLLKMSCLNLHWEFGKLLDFRSGTSFLRVGEAGQLVFLHVFVFVQRKE
eukprot:2938635-Amphidinium_carterae.1